MKGRPSAGPGCVGGQNRRGAAEKKFHQDL